MRSSSTPGALAPRPPGRGDQPPPPEQQSTRNDRLAAAVKNVASALNALSDVTATVEKKLEIDVPAEDAPRVTEAIAQGKAVTFTMPKPKPPRCERRRRRTRTTPRRPSRPMARARGAGRPKAAPPARRSSVAGRDGPDGPADPEPAELGPPLDWRHPLAGKYAHALLPREVRS